MMFHEVPIMSYKVSMWLFIGFTQSWSCLCLAVVVHRFPLVFFFPFVGCGCAQSTPGLSLALPGLWLCIGFPWSWSYIFWALVVLRLPPVLVWPLVGCGCAQVSPSFGLPMVGCGCALVFHGLSLVYNHNYKKTAFIFILKNNQRPINSYIQLTRCHLMEYD